MAYLYGSFAADFRQWFYWRGLLFAAAAGVSALMFTCGAMFFYMSLTTFVNRHKETA